ncbi:purine nucleoside phosphorylase-like isoform X1 [Bactrocera neohumeralis]|uniref:purine nucleoside phosphorylase-like isoform X1 n=1 Tax=Bactrocera neohumeralis TaxID=98809 RepID=UPI002165A794|nr:purine nucleoside phosphorylase-like isoform X1 [Bactrocera neohumeralis]
MTGFNLNGTSLLKTKALNGNSNGDANGRNNYIAEECPNDAAGSTSANNNNNNNQQDTLDEVEVENRIKMVINEENYSYELIKEIADYFLERTSIRPVIGIICGSGLNSLADHITGTQAFEYKDIPNFPVSTVEGHVGRMIFGYLEGMPVVAMQGRFHYYEGYPLAKCSMPVRVLKLVGIKYLFATNAAGGLNPKYKVGDIMIVRDHINIMGFAGNSPLQGPNDPRFGPRFPPMTNAYDRHLVRKARKVVRDMGIENDVHEGVYTCLGGPNYETVAELKMLRIMGVDAVGMSTVHEVITARHCDLTVFAFSLITNKCAFDYDSSEEDANHEEVVMVGKSRQTICGELMCRMVRELAEEMQQKNGKK